MAIRETLGGVSVVIDMSSRDYYGFRNDVLGLIPILTPLWTDLHPQDPGITTVELFCAVADNLSFYEDRCANENFLFTCTQRASGIKFARMMAYQTRQNTSALVEVDVTVSGAGTIPAGFAVSTVATQFQSAIRFELRAEYTAAGAGTYTLDFLEGESYDNDAWSSDGTADQQFILSRSPVAYNPDGTSSLVVTVKEGAGPWTQWTLVNDFQSSSATNTHYVVYVDENDEVTVKFGDGVNGKIPASGTDNIIASARIGGGITGNQVGTGLITEIISTPGIVTGVTNSSVPQGGEDKESLEEIKENIPGWVRTNDRAVTEADYAYWADSVGGVASAKASRGDNVGKSVYEMITYVRAAGYNPVPAGTWDSRTEVGTGLRGQVGTLLSSKKEGPTRVHVEGPYLVHSWLTAEVRILDTYFQHEIQEKVERALSACWNGYEYDSDGRALGLEEDLPDNAPLPDGFPRAMGDDLRRSYLQHMLESIQGVDYVNLTRLQRVPYARKVYDFGSDATWVLSVGATTVKETWTIEFLTDTTFSVCGTVSGLQATGTVGVAYATSGNELSFTITAGSIANFKGNRYEVHTSSYLETIECNDYELLTNYLGDVSYQYGDEALDGATTNPYWTLTYVGGIT